MSEQNPSFFAHQTACIDDGAKIGAGTRIWHFSHIMPDCIIGNDCNFGQNVVVSTGCIIGNNVKIQNNVSVYSAVVLEDDVFCGPSMVFTNVINPRSHINRKNEYLPTLVKKGASLGANATIVCGNTIGTYSFVGAGCVVVDDVPDYALVVGNPAKMIGYVCYCGERLNLSPKQAENASCSCKACDRQYEKIGSRVSPITAQAD